MPILFRTHDYLFHEMMINRYTGFISPRSSPKFEFEVDLVTPSAEMESEEDAHVEMQDGLWHLRRGDFRASWDPRAGRGHIRQTANPYSTDSVLRIVHTLILATEGGFLLHAASAIRDGRAFLFSGVSGAGKTTIGELLARELSWKFLEGDDLHPQANINKMRSGKPLTDKDRQPWLETLRDLIKRSLAAKENAVLACSALKKKYRDLLRVNADVKFVFLRASRERIAEQLKHRRGHFFDPKLLESQFADLEEPESADDSITVELSETPAGSVKKIEASLRKASS